MRSAAARARAQRRRVLTSLLASCAVSLSAMFGVVATASPGAATTAIGSDPYELFDSGPRGTKWQIDYTSAVGRSATCAAGTAGDGWSCTAAVPDSITNAGAASANFGSAVTSMGVDLYRSASAYGAGPFYYAHSARADCNRPGARPRWCGYPGGEEQSAYTTRANWDKYTTYQGGYWYASGAYSYEWWQPDGTWAGSVEDFPNDGAGAQQGLGGCRNCGLSLPDIVVNPPHLPPVITLGSPVGSTVHRSTPADVRQTLGMTVTSPHANNWTGSITLACPGMTTVTDTFFGLKQRSGVQASSSPITLPRENGTCTVTANAVDTSGTPTAAAATVTGTFDYVWNTAPAVPSQDAPTTGTPAVAGQPIAFSIRATDLENDPYTGLVKVYSGTQLVATVNTSEATSGAPSVGLLQSGLPACVCRYSFTATAVDQFGATSASSGSQEFSVVSASPAPNAPPGTPTLVSPTSGVTFAAGVSQTFTISATDPEAEDYRGLVTISDSSGKAVMVFTTAQAASGQLSSGAPPVALPAGSYAWTARAIDSAGQAGPPAPAQSFSVAAPPADRPPGAPTLVSPADGTTFGPNDAQVFTISASDPDGDPYTGTVTVTNTATGQRTTFTTSTGPSGTSSSGAPAPLLPAGNYTWSATASDVQGSTSASSPLRTVRVTGNSAPGTPTLVSPTSGRQLNAGERQDFLINATDADGDPYTGTVTIRDATTGAVVGTVATGLAPSGQNSMGTATPPLPTGSYTWSAHVTDAKGAAGPESGSQSFGVLAGQPTPSLSPPRSIVLSASPPVTTAGSTVQLTAATQQSVSGTGFVIEIFDDDTGTLLASCTTGLSCTASTRESAPRTDTFIAYVASPSSIRPPPNIQATSNTVQVTWK